MVLWTFLIAVFWNASFLFAQSIGQLSTQQLKDDFRFMIQAIEKHNPTLYQYHSKKTIKNSWDSLKLRLKAPMQALDYHRILAQAVALAREAHIVLGDKEAPFYAGFFNNEFQILPLEIRWVNNRLYVWRNYSSDSILAKGDEIVGINGRSPATIQKNIFPYISADGYIETYKHRVFSQEFAAHYFWFVEQCDSFKIDCIKLNTKKKQLVVLNALSRPQMSQWAKIKGFKKETALGISQIYSLYQQGTTAVLGLHNFEEIICATHNVDAATLYKKVFERIRKNKTKNLVIDLRNNKGGLKEFADELMPFVLKKNRKGYYRTLTNVQGQVLFTFFPARHRWYFNGKIYVLVNGATFSTAALIALYLKSYSKATIIGEETGSRMEGFAAGSLHYCRMPHSNIMLGIPDKWVQNSLPIQNKLHNRGLLPEFPIQPSILTLLAKKDLALEKAFYLIEKP